MLQECMKQRLRVRQTEIDTPWALDGADHYMMCSPTHLPGGTRPWWCAWSPCPAPSSRPRRSWPCSPCTPGWARWPRAAWRTTRACSLDSRRPDGWWWTRSCPPSPSVSPSVTMQAISISLSLSRSRPVISQSIQISLREAIVKKNDPGYMSFLFPPDWRLQILYSTLSTLQHFVILLKSIVSFHFLFPQMCPWYKFISWLFI